MLKIYNTLTHKVEEFNSINEKTVTVYSCGPTVYDNPHIGNLRSFVFSDVLLRVLKSNNFEVKSAQNITDIDDKIIKRAKESKKTIKDVANEYTEYFLEDIAKLNIQNPTFRPFATEYIEKMVDYIKVLMEKEYAYKENDGSIYFDISKFPEYGKLSGLETRELKTGTRNLSDEYTKDNIQDFALWKTVSVGEIGGFETELGFGRPGWHIECSVMSQSLLGNRIDIHTGGIDLVFPHHENEIAQSEAKSGERPFVNYWVHGAHMLVSGKKMSKSLNNFYTLLDLEKKGFEPIALRYLYLQTHYRQEMNFTWEALEGAQTTLNKLRSSYLKLSEGDKINEEFKEKFLDSCDNDLNMSKVLALIWENIDSLNKLTLNWADKILGFGLSEYKKQEKEISVEVKKLLEQREVLRKDKKYEEADKIREEVVKMGFEVKDN